MASRRGGGVVNRKKRGGGPEQQPAFQPNRCLNCINLKLKCSGGRPCARCFKLCLVCLPRGGAPKDNKPYVELAIQLLDIGHHNECFMQALNTFKLEGTFDRDKTVQMLHSWRGMSRMAGGDVSRGLHDAVCSLAGIAYTELEGRGSVAYDVRAPRVTPADTQVPADRRSSDSLRLKDTASFRLYDDSACMMLCMVYTDVGIIAAYNHVAAQWFASTVSRGGGEPLHQKPADPWLPHPGEHGGSE